MKTWSKLLASTAFLFSMGANGATINHSGYIPSQNATFINGITDIEANNLIYDAFFIDGESIQAPDLDFAMNIMQDIAQSFQQANLLNPHFRLGIEPELGMVYGYDPQAFFTGGGFYTEGWLFVSLDMNTFSLTSKTHIPFINLDSNGTNNVDFIGVNQLSLPIPAAFWLFSSAVAFLTCFKRVKTINGIM